ncbi:P-loop containing nucleoside triphosphate hydrolase [Arabidopsis thaliana x Arabidopsis arenosa]|nr:P-loop containing nucleoside triphosphate hydrolase [Arabidopsis thaliana x Arabidopsis arenosa]
MAETSEEQKPASSSSSRAVTFPDLPVTENVESRQEGKMEYASLRQKEKDLELCEKIVQVLGAEGPQRVLLTGKAGIGKTRLAKKVGERATERGLCFLTLCLHLNKMFKEDDEWSLYENIASQLSVYSDFEETEVDDRDEDEEEQKLQPVLLDELKTKIVEEIATREKNAKAAKEAKRVAAEKAKLVAAENAKQQAAENAKKQAAEKPKKPVEKKDEKNDKQSGDGPADGKGKSTVTEKTPPAAGDTTSAGDPYLLLILDDEDINKTSEDVVMNKLQLGKFLVDKILGKDDTRLKILVTKRKRDEELTKAGGETESQDAKSENGSEGKEGAESENGSEGQEGAKKVSEIESLEKDDKGGTDTENAHATKGDGGSGSSNENLPPVAPIPFQTTDMSDILIKSINKDYLLDLFITLIAKEDWKTYENFKHEIVEQSKNSPAAIVVLAKSLTWIKQSKKISGSSDPDLVKKMTELQEEIKKKIDEVLSAVRSGSSDSGSSSESAVNPILHLAYVLLETYDSSKGAIILDCFWHSLDFFEQCGCVYYRDLITQWILEGYFDPVRSVEKAYQDGHSILMDLINRGMLKIQENNVVVPEMAMISLIDPRRGGHFGRSRLGFSRVYGGDKEKGIGKITQIDDMIKTVQAKKADQITTILVGGDRLRRETPAKFFEKLKMLEVLGLFEPTLEPFVQSFTDHLQLLRVLIIRDCDLLESIKELKALTKLNALEVSGASSLSEISEDFFKPFLELRSLHLSGLKIKSSPPSISDLKELRCLIIKDCPLLQDLPNIQELKNLEVVDVSGASGLRTCFDNADGPKKNKSKNKNFYLLTKLQHLDFSGSQIERLPIFQDSAVAAKLHSLKRLLLRNCSKLRRLPSLKPLSGLQILDLSGTTSLVEMLEVCFEDKLELKTLNLSGTNLSELATTIEDLTGLNKLLLRNCINLDAIPNIEKLENLEVIDVFGSAKLAKIEGSFEKMFYLREVNLSGTQVETPELPTDTKIHCLKRFTRADGTCYERDTWREIKEDIERDRSENASASDAVVTSQEITEKKSGEISEVESNAPRPSDCTEKVDVSKERLLKVPIDRALYQKALTLLVDSKIPQEEVLEINETNKLDEEALANVEFVSFVDCTPERVKSIFEKAKLVKRCWLRMCFYIKDPFDGVDEENLKSLETLSITNLLSLETISFIAKLENLKDLSLDCCPNIKTIFPEMPASLPVLNLKHCENLEKVVVGVEVSTHTNLDLEVENCPKFGDYVMVELSDAPPAHEC